MEVTTMSTTITSTAINPDVLDLLSGVVEANPLEREIQATIVSGCDDCNGMSCAWDCGYTK